MTPSTEYCLPKKQALLCIGLLLPRLWPTYPSLVLWKEQRDILEGLQASLVFPELDTNSKLEFLFGY